MVSNIGKGGHQAITQVKTVHARYSKTFLEEKMKEYLGDTRITLEGYAENKDTYLVVIGNK